MLKFASKLELEKISFDSMLLFCNVAKS